MNNIFKRRVTVRNSIPNDLKTGTRANALVKYGSKVIGLILSLEKGRVTMVF